MRRIQWQKRLVDVAMCVAAVWMGGTSKVSGVGTTNGVASTPPMGWNSYNTFGLSSSETLIR